MSSADVSRLVDELVNRPSGEGVTRCARVAEW